MAWDSKRFWLKLQFLAIQRIHFLVRNNNNTGTLAAPWLQIVGKMHKSFGIDRHLTGIFFHSESHKMPLFCGEKVRILNDAGFKSNIPPPSTQRTPRGDLRVRMR